MLHELRVENLLLMERAELRLVPTLNVLTGETGAGKTLLAHALDLLLGGRARSGIVREGAAEAYVEGVFSLPPGFDPVADERLADDASEIVLARRVWPDGRTRAYVCGRSATVADLRELGSLLLSFYGQHEHRKLMLGAAQLEILDANCGPDQEAVRARLSSVHERVRELSAQMSELEALAGARDRELDLVAFELDEIESVAPSEAEEAELVAERDRLRNLEMLRAAAAAGSEAIAPDAGDGVAVVLAAAAAQLEQAAAVDPALAPLAERLQALRFEAEDLGGELRDYLLGIEGAPGRLEEVEERLALFARLQRKHGGSIADVLRHAERCRARRDELEGAEVALEGAAAELAAATAERDELAGALTAARRAAAPKLAKAVRARLAELAMPDAVFDVVVSPRADGCSWRGADTVEFMIAPNAGLPAGPLREIASGGELSRVMLALLSVAHGGDSQGGGRRRGVSNGDRSDPVSEARPLLVFDEIDAGIGGHTARAVGEHLRKLSSARQILCITHLPQVAALGERHFTIVKDGSASPALTTVELLEGDGIVGELVRMLGAGEGDRAASQHARQLLKAA
jgi:DNA repair protein RecN (Recombination protein N)